jgi:hypothetical protein
VAVSPDGKLLLTGCMGANQSEAFGGYLWNLQTGQQVAALAPPSNRFYRPRLRAAFAASGRLVLGSPGNEDVAIWEVPNGRLLRQIEARRAT